MYAHNQLSKTRVMKFLQRSDRRVNVTKTILQTTVRIKEGKIHYAERGETDENSTTEIMTKTR